MSTGLHHAFGAARGDQVGGLTTSLGHTGELGRGVHVRMDCSGEATDIDEVRELGTVALIHRQSHDFGGSAPYRM